MGGGRRRLSRQNLTGATPWIDAHSHLADPRIESCLESILRRSRDAGVGAWIQGGYDPADWSRQRDLALAQAFGVYPSYGLHPWWVAVHTDEECEQALFALEQALGDGQAVGLGELGLDFGEKRLLASGEGAERVKARQERVFVRQLELALRLDFPLIIHFVRAHAEALSVLKKVGVPRAGGMVHSFSGGSEVAREFLKLGLLISVSGAVTRKGYETLKRAVASIPPQSLVIETDSPDQMPSGFESPSSWNEPMVLFQIAEAVGALRGESARDLLNQSRENLFRVFGVSENE